METPIERPSFGVLLASYALLPFLLIVLLIAVIYRRIQKERLQRKYKKLFGRRMNTIEEIMYDLEHPLFPSKK